MYFSCVSPSRSDLAASSLYEQGSWALRPSSRPRGRGSGLCWAHAASGVCTRPGDTESSDPHSRTPSHLITVQFPLCPARLAMSAGPPRPPGVLGCPVLRHLSLFCGPQCWREPGIAPSKTLTLPFVTMGFGRHSLSPSQGAPTSSLIKSC